MNIKSLFILSLSWVAVGCVSDGILSVPKCQPYEPIVGPCNGSKSNPKVTININANSLNFSPRNVCAAPGKTIVFTIVPPPQNKIGSAAIIPKNMADLWLIGTNGANKNKIEITVPEWVASGTDHDYGFATIDGDCVDPRVHVEN